MNRKRPARSFFVGLLACLAIASASVVHAAGRVALVVGNSTYSAIGPLPNPGNDAADMSAALRRLGFDVTTVLDADRGELTEALRTFTRASAGADVSLVFYAGHGLEVDGVNYLVPVDARLERDTDVRFETVELDYALAATTGAALRVVILDACRNTRWPVRCSVRGRRGASAGGASGTWTSRCWGTRRWWRMRRRQERRRRTGRAGTVRTRRRCSCTWSGRWRSVCCFDGCGRRCWRRRTESSGRTSNQSLVGEHFLLSGVPGATAVTVEADAPGVVDAVAVDVEELDVPDVADVDVTEIAIARLLRLADQGDPRAQDELGARYVQGRGVETDYAEAVRWYRRAADQGFARAQSNLGDAYENGRGVQQNYCEALRWFLRAADQGEPYAQANLGDLYREGHGVSQDDEEAVRWYRRSAGQGLPFAQTSLGWMYENGRGVPAGSCRSGPVVRLGRRSGARGSTEETRRPAVNPIGRRTRRCRGRAGAAAGLRRDRGR